MIVSPSLAGATGRDRVTASIGALIGMVATYLICAWALPPGWPLPLLVAPMGASAVLVFAVPASPLAQPWAVIGGNVVSAAVGVAAARYVPVLPLAIGVSVSGAILVMSLLRCLHPPGGAAALTAVIGGPAIAAAGFSFPFLPVGIDAVVLTAAGLVFHQFSGHSYPHRSSVAAGDPAAIADLHRDDIDAALRDLGETLDVTHDDLALILHRAETHAARRRGTGR